MDSPLPPAQGQEKVGPGFWQAVLLMVIVGGIILLTAIVMASLLIILDNVLDQDTGTLESGSLTAWSVVFSNTLAIAIALKIGKRWFRRSWSEILPLTKIPALLYLALVPLSLGLLILLSDCDNALRMIMPAPEWINEAMSKITSSGVASFFAIVVVAPLTEEFLFRGLVLDGFLRRYSPRIAVLASALLFSLFHMNPYQMISSFVIGCLLGWLRLRSGSLIPCLLCHALNNGAVFLFMHLPVEIPGFNTDPSIPVFQPLWFDGLGLAMLVVGALATVGLVKRSYSTATSLDPTASTPPPTAKPLR